jgi:hypothetical protein
LAQPFFKRDDLLADRAMRDAEPISRRRQIL